MLSRAAPVPACPLRVGWMQRERSVGSVYAIWRMLARRGLANWRLTATLVLGVLVAATLLAAAPIYARAMADLGLTFAIRERLRTAPATQVLVRDVPVSAADGQRLQEAVARRVEERIGWFAGERARVVQGPRFAVALAGQPPADRPPFAVPAFVAGAETHTRVLDGRRPADRPGADGLSVVELALSPRGAEAAGLKVGDRITLHEYFDDCERELPRDDRPPPPPCFPRVGVRYTIPAEVVGIVEPIDREDPFWVGRAGSLFEPFRLDIPGAGPFVPMLTTEAGLFQGLGGRAPQLRAGFSWVYLADPERLSRANYRRAREDIAALREDMAQVGGFAFSPLEGALDSFGRELRYQQTPLTLLLLQIAGIALFYVGVIAAMVVERQADEIALLRSRGASRLQVVGLYLVEGLTIGLPVTLAAPFLAALATALLGLTPTFHRVTGGDPLPVQIGPTAFALAALGAVLSLVVLAGPAFLMARMTGVTARRQTARPDVPFFRRYYLDLALAALAGLLLWELSERGSVFTPSPTGGVSSDPLLLISPGLFTLAAAALALRFYPALLRLAAALVAAVAGVPLVMGLWQVVRNPGQYTRLALLLMMAVAVGTFAASYASTAERSYRDRAAFEAGVEVRAGLGDTVFSAADVMAEVAKIPGVAQAAPVVRATASPATPGGGLSDIMLVGVDPDAAAAMLWFRADLADEPLPALMERLRGPVPRGKPLPPGTTAVAVWVNPAEARETVTLWVRVRDANGAAAMYELGKLDFTGWRQLRADLAAPYSPSLTPPLTLVSFVLSEPSNVIVTRTAPVYLDDVTAEGPAGATVIEDFEGPQVWEAAPARTAARGGSLQDEFRVTSEQRHGGQAAGRFAFRTGTATGLRGIYVKDPMVPLPVVVSPGFIGITGAGVGQTTLIASGDALIPVVVRGVARLFPSVPAGTPFVVANRDQVMAWTATFSDSALRRVNEVWIRPEAGVDRAALARALETSRLRLNAVVDRERVLAAINANPLIAAGGSGILVTAFLAVLGLVGMALVVTLIASVQRRRTEFAVMRAMGVSRGQVFRLLAVEYTLVAVLGLAGGVALGLVIGRRMLSFLEVTETGGAVAPPFILQTNWLMVGAAVGGVALTFLVAMALSTRMVVRQATGQVLRQTE
jgi:hypothetical protein